MLRRRSTFALIAAVILLFVMPAAHASNIPLLPMGAAWLYSDDGSDQGTVWSQPAYIPTGWSIGNAELGYGDGDEGQVIHYGPDPNNKYVTYYFLKNIWVNDPDEFTHLWLQLIRDDGAIVYINGTEVMRNNMPAGSVTYSTLANGQVNAPAEQEPVSQMISASGLLNPGWNRIAVEVHQFLPTSSDVSFDLDITGLQGAGLSLVTRGPYLQRAAPDQIVVRWRTAAATESVVRYGLQPNAQVNAVTNPILSTEHRVELHDLAPNTTYYYSVGNNTQMLAGLDQWHHFTTPPGQGEARRTRIWVLGDPGYETEDARTVRDAFFNWNGSATPDLWLILGDNAYDQGTDEQYQKGFFGKYQETLRSSPVWTVYGNHDALSADSATLTGPYYENFSLPRYGEAGGVVSSTEAYYSFNYANIHVVILDSEESNREIGGPMYNWLTADLTANTQRWTIVSLHRSLYSKGSHDSDTSTTADAFRQNFLPLIESNNVDLVLNGHSHAYERSFLLHGHYGLSTSLTESMKVDGGDGNESGTGAYDKTATNGTVYVVSGAGALLRTIGTFDHPANQTNILSLGSLVIDVHGTRMDVRYIDNTPTVLDHFTIVKGSLHTLTVTHDAGGATSTTGGTYYAESLVTIEATASDYHTFEGWTGAVTSSMTIVMLNVTNDMAVHADFDPYLLTNGTPQWWLAKNGLGTNHAAALSDTDDDLMAAWEEYIAGTIPTSGVSSLTFSDTLLNSGGQPAIVWNSVSNRIYDVLACPTPDGPFSSIASNIVATPPANSLDLPPDSRPTMYYHIRVRMP